MDRRTAVHGGYRPRGWKESGVTERLIYIIKRLMGLPYIIKRTTI